MITAPSTQIALRDQLLRDIRALNEQVNAVAEALTPAQLAWLPPENGWSVAQVFEHLCIAHDSYLGRIEQLLDGSALPQRVGSDVPWAPRFAGAFLVRALRAPRKLPAPRSYRVGPRARPRVIAEFLERQAQLERLIQRADPVEWRAARLGSPVASVIRLNLGDAFLINVVHAQRHLAQIERVRAAMSAGGA